MLVLTRYLDNESYGMIGMFSLCVSIFSILVGFSSHGSLLVRYGNSMENWYFLDFFNATRAFIWDTYCCFFNFFVF